MGRGGVQSLRRVSVRNGASVQNEGSVLVSRSPPILIRRRLESETLHLPELKNLIGKDVEIVVSERDSRVAPPDDSASLQSPELSGDAFDGFDEALEAWRKEPWRREDD